eukprot:scaffold55403_cov100-Phaeocystis_antarctica.AAC.5
MAPGDRERDVYAHRQGARAWKTEVRPTLAPVAGTPNNGQAHIVTSSLVCWDFYHFVHVARPRVVT